MAWPDLIPEEYPAGSRVFTTRTRSYCNPLGRDKSQSVAGISGADSNGQCITNSAHIATDHMGQRRQKHAL